ncbi:MAG: FecR domain-containing protein [Balneolales bacterium]
MNNKISHSKIIQYLTGDPDLNETDKDEILNFLQHDVELRQRIGIAGPKNDIKASKQRLINRISKKEQMEKATVKNRMLLHYVPIWFVKVAAVFVIITSALFLISHLSDIDYDDNQIINRETISTNKGQRARAFLADGTEVHLGVETTLEYGNGLVGENREVYLEGEAFFKVTSNKKRPFIVYAGGTITEVIGTEFSVRSYPDDKEIITVVNEGKVSFGNKFSNSVILSKGNLGRINRADMSEVSVLEDINLEQYLGWKDGHLIFKDAVFGDIQTYFERWYNIKIYFIDEELKQRRLTGSFHNESLRDVLKIIAISLDMEYTIEDKDVYFSLK